MGLAACGKIVLCVPTKDFSESECHSVVHIIYRDKFRDLFQFLEDFRS